MIDEKYWKMYTEQFFFLFLFSSLKLITCLINKEMNKVGNLIVVVHWNCSVKGDSRHCLGVCSRRLCTCRKLHGDFDFFSFSIEFRLRFELLQLHNVKIYPASYVDL